MMTPFTGSILPAGKARAAPWCWHHKQCATRPAVKSARPSVARIGPPGALRRLPDALHRAARRAYPGGPIRATEGRALLPAGRVAPCLWCQHNGAARALPAGKIDPVKGIIISAHRY